MTGADWRRDVLDYWFGLEPAQWWSGDAELDCRIKQDFLALWTDKRQLPAGSFLTDPLTALAGVILFDQFPRNMFRGHADQFATDQLAQAISRAAVERGFDGELAKNEKLFLYMPLMHSEALSDQDRALTLFTALGDASQLRFATQHRDLIARFGRFPHRNAILGRRSRPEEVAAGADKPW